MVVDGAQARPILDPSMRSPVRRPSEPAGGRQQRVAIVRALFRASALLAAQRFEWLWRGWCQRERGPASADLGAYFPGLGAAVGVTSADS